MNHFLILDDVVYRFKSYQDLKVAQFCAHLLNHTEKLDNGALIGSSAVSYKGDLPVLDGHDELFFLSWDDVRVNASSYQFIYHVVSGDYLLTTEANEIIEVRHRDGHQNLLTFEGVEYGTSPSILNTGLRVRIPFNNWDVEKAFRNEEITTDDIFLAVKAVGLLTQAYTSLVIGAENIDVNLTLKYFVNQLDALCPNGNVGTIKHDGTTLLAWTRVGGRFEVFARLGGSETAELKVFGKSVSFAYANWSQKYEV